MNYIYFITLNFFSAFGIFYFFYHTNFEKGEKLMKHKSLKILIIILLTVGLIGNFFLSKQLLGK